MCELDSLAHPIEQELCRTRASLLGSVFGDVAHVCDAVVFKAFFGWIRQWTVPHGFERFQTALPDQRAQLVVVAEERTLVFVEEGQGRSGECGLLHDLVHFLSVSLVVLGLTQQVVQPESAFCISIADSHCGSVP